MNEAKNVTFGIVDFVVLAGTLGLTILIGVYYAFKDRKKATMDSYYFGGRNMSPWPVGLSIAVTYVSAITTITFPAECYSFGMVSAWFTIAMVVPNIVQCLFYIPLVHRLKLTSLFEFLELRFDHRIRKLESVITCLVVIFIMSMSTYIPGLALNAVTPLSIVVNIIITGAVCTFYTTVGGMKAVVWADAFQTFVMLAGCLSVLIKTLIVVGGFGNVFAALERGQRNNFFTFNLDPTIRYTFWTIIGGTAVSWSTPNQAIIQRFLTCGTVKKARQAAMFSCVPGILFVGVSIFSGAVMYAYYEECDLLKSKVIEKPEQMIPYLVLEIFHDVPGMAGLFVAASISGTLSTVSSGINSLASLLMEDFIIVWKPELSQYLKLTISKLIVLCFGVLVTGVAISITFIEATVFQILYSFFGTLNGPLLGVFVMGMMFPWTNAMGAIIGQVIGTGLTGWISFGSIFQAKFSSANQPLPTSIDGCPSSNTTNTTEFTTFAATQAPTATEPENYGIETTLYAISFLLYNMISVIVTVFFGLIFSFITGANNPAESNPDLFIPMISHSIFPKKMRKFFRFGVPQRKKNKVQDLAEAEIWITNDDQNKVITSRDDDLRETSI